MESFGQNIVVEVKDGKAIFTVDLTEELGESSSGKSVIIATTGGNQSIPGREDIKVGLNVYRKKK